MISSSRKLQDMSCDSAIYELFNQYYWIHECIHCIINTFKPLKWSNNAHSESKMVDTLLHLMQTTNFNTLMTQRFVFQYFSIKKWMFSNNSFIGVPTFHANNYQPFTKSDCWFFSRFLHYQLQNGTNFKVKSPQINIKSNRILKCLLFQLLNTIVFYLILKRFNKWIKPK